MTKPLRVLALDHFSGQDRSALVAEGGERFRWRALPYWQLRDAANRFFPPEVMDDLEPFTREAFSSQRDAYASWLREEMARLYGEWPYDVVVLPSDT
jgi:hypothetical protein